jgi:hypothetical protein
MTKIGETKIQGYSSVNDTIGKTMTIEQVIWLFKSDKYKKDTGYLRGEEDKNKRKEYKKKHLPAVIWQGTFLTREKVGLKVASGLACHDFDDYDLEKSKHTKEELKKLPYIFATIISPSGGLKVVSRIPVVKDDLEYKKYWLALEKEFSKYSVANDKGCKDVSRLCFLSHDPEMYVNYNAQIFDIKIVDKELSFDVIKGPDTSRSGIEYTQILKFISAGLSKEKIFRIMASSEKWSEEGAHYRERTYSRALEYCNKNNPVKGKELIAVDFITRTLADIREKGYPELKWKIDKLIPDSGIVIFGGPSGCYKTWVGLDLALSVCSGEQFLFNYPTTKGNVLYVDEENGDITLPHRFELLIKGRNIEEQFQNLHIATFSGLKLDVPHTEDVLKEFIRKNEIKLIVFDSMVRCMVGVEDKSSDVRLVFETLKQLLKEFKDLSIIILHHTSKGKGKGMDKLRGSGDFAAFADVVIMFESKFGGKVNLELVKNRHIDLTQFNKLSFEVLKTDNEGLTLGYLPYKEANMDVVNSCKKEMMEYLDSKQLKAFSTGTLMKEMIGRGFSKNSFYSARKELMEEDIISKLAHGRYEYNSQIIEEVEMM